MIYLHTNVAAVPVGSNSFEKILVGGSSEPTVIRCDSHYLIFNIEVAK